MTLADRVDELVRSRKAAMAATAAAVTATAVVTGVLVSTGDDGGRAERPGDSLGVEATGEPTSDPSEEPTPPPADLVTTAPDGGSAGHLDASGSPEGDEKRRASEEPNGDHIIGGTGPGGCGSSNDPQTEPSSGSEPGSEPTSSDTAGHRAGRQAQHPEQSGSPDPSPHQTGSPSPTPTDTTVEPTEPAPSSASATSSASPDSAEPTATPSPTGSSYTTCVVVGRPMWRDGDLLVPDVRDGHPDHHDLPLPDVTGLDPRDRAALAELWTQAARGELASVPAFHDLALVLSALGAPLDLIGRATQAALDEVDHTRRSFALAGAYAGAPVEGGPVPGLLGRRIGQASTPRAALTRLAVEALKDGCLHEGHAAAVARLAADGATDPGVRASLDVIATDEAGHAVLSHDLLAWCLATGDRRLATRIRRELAELPTEAPAWPTADADPVVLEQHGWPSRDTVVRAFEAHRTALVARVEGLLVGNL